MKREAWRCCWKAPKAAAAANGLAAEANGLAEACADLVDAAEKLNRLLMLNGWLDEGFS